MQTFFSQAATGATGPSAIDDFVNCFNDCQASFGRTERLRRTTLLGCSALAGITGALALPALQAAAVPGLSAALGLCIATLGGFEVGLATNCVARCLPRLLQALPTMTPVIPGGRIGPVSLLPPGIPGLPPELAGLLGLPAGGGIGGADVAAAPGLGSGNTYTGTIGPAPASAAAVGATHVVQTAVGNLLAQPADPDSLDQLTLAARTGRPAAFTPVGVNRSSQVMLVSSVRCL